MSNFKELKTTITGLILWAGDAFYALTPFFSDRELWDVNALYVGFAIFVGLIFVVSKDDLITNLFDFIFGFLKKKTDG